jgi:hypothetical protein
MHRLPRLFLLVFFFAIAVKAEEKSAGFLIDYHLSPQASATTFIGINKALAAAEDLALEKHPLFLSKPWQIVLRSGELAALWFPVNYFSMLIQHEFFGHGVKCYEFGAKPALIFKDMVYNFPPPYGKGVIWAQCYDYPNDFSAAKGLLRLTAPS